MAMSPRFGLTTHSRPSTTSRTGAKKAGSWCVLNPAGRLPPLFGRRRLIRFRRRSAELYFISDWYLIAQRHHVEFSRYTHSLGWPVPSRPSLNSQQSNLLCSDELPASARSGPSRIAEIRLTMCPLFYSGLSHEQYESYRY